MFKQTFPRIFQQLWILINHIFCQFLTWLVNHLYLSRSPDNYQPQILQISFAMPLVSYISPFDVIFSMGFTPAYSQNLSNYSDKVFSLFLLDSWLFSSPVKNFLLRIPPTPYWLEGYTFFGQKTDKFSKIPLCSLEDCDLL